MAAKWKKNSEELVKAVSQKMDRISGEIKRIERLGGRTFVYRKLYGDAEVNFNLAKNGYAIHNLPYGEELLEVASQRLDEAIQQLSKRKQALAQEKGSKQAGSK